MVAKSISILAIALVLLAGPAVQAQEIGIKSAIDQAVQDAMQKILQGLGSATNQIANNVATNVNQVQSTVGSITQPLVNPIVTTQRELVNSALNMGQTVMNGYRSLGAQAVGSLANLGSAWGGAFDQLETVMGVYDAQYCTPAAFTPSVKKPAKFTGPGFELILSAGECAFDDEALIEENKKQLNCIEPSITLIKTPANFTSKYKTAPTFVSKECKVTKKFGEDIQKVLYVFDGSSPVDLNAITATVMNEIRGVTGAIGGAHQALAGQLGSFINAIPHPLAGGLKFPGFGGATA